MAVSWADRNFEKGNHDDNFRAASRFRTQIDVIASENLKGVVFFEIGHQNWGYTSQGASLGTDGKEVKVRYSYVDWVVPNTDARVRVGLQKYTLPNFTGIARPSLMRTRRASASTTSSPRTSAPTSSGCARPTTTIPTARSTTPTTPWTSRA